MEWIVAGIGLKLGWFLGELLLLALVAVLFIGFVIWHSRR